MNNNRDGNKSTVVKHGNPTIVKKMVEIENLQPEQGCAKQEHQRDRLRQKEQGRQEYYIDIVKEIAGLEIDCAYDLKSSARALFFDLAVQVCYRLLRIQSYVFAFVRTRKA